MGMALVLALLCIPICYVLTMALFGAYLAHAKALPITIAFMVALIVFAGLTA